MPHAHATVQALRPAGSERAATSPEAARPRIPTSLADRRSMPQMLDQALEVLREHFALLVGLSTLCWLPVRALQPFLGQHVWEKRGGDAALFGQGLSTLTSTAGAALAQTLAAALLARILFGELEGRAVPVLGSLRATILRLPAVVAIAAIVMVATAAGTCACFVPGILLSWKLALAPAACVLEGERVGASLKRSFLLTSRGFWRWVGLVSCTKFLMMPLTGITSLADLPALRGEALRWSGLSAASYDLWLVVISSLTLGVATALHTAAMVVYYTDCRVRREGIDLERSLEELPQPASLRGSSA